MGHEHCGYCNSVPCECDRQVRVVPVAAIIGDDEKAVIVPDESLQVGRVSLGPEKKGIVADPITGQGCLRGVPYDKTEAWDMVIPICRLPGEIDEPFMPILDKEILVDKPQTESKEELGQGMNGGGKRYNKGKTLLELLPPEWAWALADVTTQGSKKYEKRNWERGMDWSTMVGCMERHLKKFEAGERYDGPEFNLERGTTGCHHLAMVAWNALALMVYDLRQIGNNDLPHPADFKRVNAATSDLGESIHESK